MISKSEAINSPFRYAGGKFYARNLILEYITPHSHYIEPFAGGASIFFAKPKVKNNWLNDMDKDLINTYLIIRDKPEELIKSLDGEEASKERHSFYKKQFVPSNELEVALRWFYLNRTSYSGIMKQQNCYWGYGEKYSMRPENWPRHIRRTSEKLQNTNITCLDFEKVIENSPDGSFLFIDPPYFNADQDKFYTHCFSKNDHYRLCEIIKKNTNRFKFLLTYDNSPEIRELYEWAKEIHNKEWNYTLSRTDDQKNRQKKENNFKGERSKGKEIFILNYLHENTLPLTHQKTKQLAIHLSL